MTTRGPVLVDPALQKQAIAAAGERLAQSRIDSAALPPRELAERCYVPDGPSVDELEARIRAQRGLDVADQPTHGSP